MFWYEHDLSAWGWVGMILAMVAFWAFIAAVILWIIRATTRPERTAVWPDAQQVLAERFARGEIDEAEYHDRLAALRGEKRPAVRS